VERANRLLALALFIEIFLLATIASAQTIDLRGLAGPGQGSVSGRIIQLVSLLTVLSIAPGILVTVTCFTRFVIVFSFLRAGLGLPSSPSNIVLISLALFMTYFVMAPTLDRMWAEGVAPLIENKIDEPEAARRMMVPLREYMLVNVRDRDLRLMQDLAARRGGTTASTSEPLDMRVLVPAFMISELRRAFEIGFLILLPFLVIDLVVATLVMSMGMMMLPPTSISLPFKVLFFVLIDGWNLLVGSLVRSVTT
jgi:flagellar biosynthetic protein FliP